MTDLFLGLSPSAAASFRGHPNNFPSVAAARARRVRTYMPCPGLRHRVYRTFGALLQPSDASIGVGGSCERLIINGSVIDGAYT